MIGSIFILVPGLMAFHLPNNIRPHPMTSVISNRQGVMTKFVFEFHPSGGNSRDVAFMNEVLLH